MPHESIQDEEPLASVGGSRRRREIRIKSMLEAEAEAVYRRVIERALAGDMKALSLVLVAAVS